MDTFGYRFCCEICEEVPSCVVSHEGVIARISQAHAFVHLASYYRSRQ